MYVPVCICVNHVYAGAREVGGGQSPLRGIIDSCEPPIVGAGTWVLIMEPWVDLTT